MNSPLKFILGSQRLGFTARVIFIAWMMIVSSAALRAVEGKIPTGMTDPGRSVWIQFGETNQEVGLTMVKSGEGDPRLMKVAGVTAMTVDKTRGRLLYLQVAPWFTASEVTITIDYFDADSGPISIEYDSWDEKVQLPPSPKGVWKVAKDVINCDGIGKWQQGSFHLADARFSRECNGADLRIGIGTQGDFPIRAIWITAASKEPPLPRHVVEFVDSKGKVTDRHEARDNERFQLVGANYEYVFDPIGLLSIKERRGGVMLSSADKSYSPMALALNKGRLRNMECSLDEMPSVIRLLGGKEPTAIEYRWGCAEMVQATLRIEKKSDELTCWKVSSLTPGPAGTKNASLSNVQFPYLRGLAVGAKSKDTWFVAPGYGAHGSGVYYNPLEGGIGRNLSMAINWLSLYDQTNKCGLGMFLDDRNDLDVYASCESDPQKGKGGPSIKFLFPATPTTLPDAYVMVHRGDWHQVADQYRTVVAVRDPQPENPAWALDLDAWTGMGNTIDLGFSFIPDFYRAVSTQAQNSGQLLNINRSMYDGPWSYCGVYPYPCPLYGSAEELRETALRVHDQGGRMIYYINYMLSMPDGPDVKRIGPAAKSFLPKNVPPPFVSPESKPLTGRSFTGLDEDQYGVDRSLRAWSDRNLFWAKWYAKELLADGIYWDQLSCIPGGLKETAWNLERMTKECRQIQPTFITGGEGVGQSHGRSLTFGLASAVFHRSELYRYTFPRHLVMDGSANNGSSWTGKDKRWNVLFLNGCRYDNLPSQDAIFAQNTMTLRKRTKQLLYQATFRDTEGITLMLPASVSVPVLEPGQQVAPWGGIQAKRHVLNTASSKLILINTVNEPGVQGAIATIDTGDVGAIRKAWVFLWDGTLHPLEFKEVSKTSVSFSVPTTMQATVVLVNCCAPILYPKMPTAMLSAGGKGEAKVEILNLNADPIVGEVSWKAPEGWHFSSTAFGPVAPGETASVACVLQIGAKAERKIHDCWCMAETREKLASQSYTPISVVPSPYVDWSYESGGQLKATLHNLGGDALDTVVSVEFPKDCPVGIEPKQKSISIAAGARGEALFRFTGLEKMQTPAGIYIVISGKVGTQRIPIRLFPSLSNGGFEIDLAGDGKPEYWTTYDFQGKAPIGATYPLINLDSKVIHEGRYSLRIDPCTIEEAHTNVYPLSNMLFPDTTYRFTIYGRVPKDGQLRILGLDYQPIPPVGEPSAAGWQKYERVFKTEHDTRGRYSLINTGKTPVWVDSASVTIDSLVK